MTIEELIRDFEIEVSEITRSSILKLDNSKNTLIVFDEFQKEIANAFSNNIHKAIMNNVKDRNNMIEIMSDLSIKYATELKSGLSENIKGGDGMGNG